MKANKSCKASKHRINKVEVTDERITGRAGLSLFVRYLEQSRIMVNLILPMFKGLRKIKKGAPVEEIFKQVLCFFLDGTSRHLSHFDRMKNDTGYAATIETDPNWMVSSHTVKRFFQSFSWPLIWSFRWILLVFFSWRLLQSEPDIIILDMDGVIMNNDQAEAREGVNPTYKKKKGFAPLKLTWEGFIVDSVFRSGERHSNFGNDAEQMVTRVVQKIRKHYSSTVPIVLHADSGFFDQKLFKCCEELGIAYVIGGRLYKDITKWVDKVTDKHWQRYFGPGRIEDNRIWEYLEFGDKRESWNKFRRTIFTRPMTDEKRQGILPSVRPCTVVYTNLGRGYEVDDQLIRAGYGHLLNTEGVIRLYHDRGQSELTFRAFKDFGFEELPFKKFRANAAFYYCMVLGFNLYEAFKEDVCSEIVPLCSYPTTLRRTVIDIGAKVVRTSKQTILRLTRSAWEMLDFNNLWIRSNNPSHFIPA